MSDQPINPTSQNGPLQDSPFVPKPPQQPRQPLNTDFPQVHAAGLMDGTGRTLQDLEQERLDIQRKAIQASQPVQPTATTGNIAPAATQQQPTTKWGMPAQQQTPVEPVQQQAPVERVQPREKPTASQPAQTTSGIDQQIPWDQLPTQKQFDNTGAVREIPPQPTIHPSIPAPAAESQVKGAGLRLTEEQRGKLRQHAPNLYKVLESVEKGQGVPRIGRAAFETHPFRPATDMFGENPTSWVYSDLSHQGIRELAAHFLALDMSDPRNQELTNEISAAVSQNPNEDFGLEALTRPGSEWTQSIKTPNGYHIHGKVYKYDKSQVSQLRGPQAIAFAAAISGAGRPSTFPMMSSGWHAQFKPASSTDWTLYHEEAIEKRAELGRSTLGVGFSASRAMFVEHSLNFALNNMESTSFKVPAAIEDRASLMKYLRVSDIDSFLTGFLVACHPDGYPIRMPCSNIGKCTHVIELDANLRTMAIFDRTIPSEHHLNHMANAGSASVEFESMLSYQQTLRTNQPRLVELRKSTLTGEPIVIEFHNPSVYDYLQSSRRWIERVKSMMGVMLKDSTTMARRIELQNRFYWTAPMRDYGHLVKSIRIGGAIIDEDPTNKDNPRADIEDYLTQVSENDAIREAFRKEAISYMNSTITTLVAVPSYECPVCKHNNVTEETLEDGFRFHNCIPVDVPMVFFNLALRRLMQLGN